MTRASGNTIKESFSGLTKKKEKLTRGERTLFPGTEMGCCGGGRWGFASRGGFRGRSSQKRYFTINIADGKRPTENAPVGRVFQARR